MFRDEVSFEFRISMDDFAHSVLRESGEERGIFRRLGVGRDCVYFPKKRGAIYLHKKLNVWAGGMESGMVDLATDR